MESREQTIAKINQFSTRMRTKILNMAHAVGGSSHIGGGLSMVDITATLYSTILKLDPSNPEWPDRDRFILSKGHGVLGYYTALSEAGFISEADLMQFEKTDSYLLGHPVINRKKGIEFSNGSLGMGLGLGIGVALAGRKRGKDYKVYVLMGDGECNEGSVWEAAMAAPQFKLDNLVAILDRNNLQQTGTNKDIMSVGDLAAKWRSFGWDVTEVDGHNTGELYDTFTKEKTPGVPRAIVAHTVKGKGLSFAENNNDWHHATLTQNHYQTAMAELTKAQGQT